MILLWPFGKRRRQSHFLSAIVVAGSGAPLSSPSVAVGSSSVPSISAPAMPNATTGLLRRVSLAPNDKQAVIRSIPKESKFRKSIRLNSTTFFPTLNRAQKEHRYWRGGKPAAPKEVFLNSRFFLLFRTT